MSTTPVRGAMIGIVLSTTAVAQPPMVVSSTGRLFGMPSAATATMARLGVVTPNVLVVLDAAASDSGRPLVASSVTAVLPITSALRAVVGGQYGEPLYRAGSAARLELGVTSGLWAGIRTGSARVDSLGIDPWSHPPPSFALPIRGPTLGGPWGFGGGAWTEQWGIVFGASATAGVEEFRARYIAEHVVQITIPVTSGDSTTQQIVADTMGVRRATTSWLGAVSAHWEVSRLTLDARAGVVNPPNAPRVGWAGASASLRVVSNLSLVIAAGTRGLPLASVVDPRRERAYVTGGLSVGWPSSVVPRRPLTVDGMSRDMAYRLDRTDTGYVLVIRVPDASRVEVMGDLTDWVPVDCDEGRQDEWIMPRAVPVGVHHLVIRIDDGKWIALPGALKEISEFGDVVGVIATPDRR